MHANRVIPMDQCAFRLVTDADGEWFEFGFLSAHELDGNATDGYTDPGNYIRLIPENSDDLVTWHEGNFIPCPTGAVVDNLDGTFWYWSRSVWPKYQKSALVDFDLRSARGGKSITALNLFGANITLPNYPYAVETAMSQLQTDLREAGYTDAIASYTPAAYTVDVIRHWTDGSFMTGYRQDQFLVEHTGESVTGVRNPSGTFLSLPGYPYALPTQAAQLQADLIAAGHSGSVVRLFAGEWRIFLPNRTTESLQSSRLLIATFTPDDPHPEWDANNTYRGLISDNKESKPYSNLRTSGGLAVTDASKRQFARLKLQAGTRPGADALTGALLNWLKQENLP